MSFQLSDTEKSTLLVTPVNSRGNVVPNGLSSVPVWTITPAANVAGEPTGTLTISADGMSAVFASVSLGAVLVTATAKNKNGVDIFGSLAITIEPGAAVALAISASAPEPQ